jgi:hypothetical protein
LLAIDPKDPATLYANAAGGLSKSIDAGMSWSTLNTELPAAGSLIIDPQNTSTLYVARQGNQTRGGGGVWKSADAGTSWTRPELQPDGGGVHGLAMDPQDSSVLYAWNGKGLFKSPDSEASWNWVGPKSGLALAIDPQNPSTMYFAAGDSGVFKSTDGGTNWNTSNSGLPSAAYNGTQNYRVTALAIDPRNTNTVYAGTAGFGVFRSTDGGATWSGLNSGLTALSVTSFAIDSHDTRTIYAGTPGGVFAIRLDP